MLRSSLSTLFGILSIAVVASAQDNPAIKRILSDYETIVKSHEDWPQISFSAVGIGEGGGTIYRIARSEESPALMRIEIERLDDHGPIQTTSYFRDDALEFVLRRVETTPMQEKAPTEVIERRYYFDNETLIRALEKKGSFPAGQEPSMDKIKNTVLALDAIDDAATLCGQFSSEALEAMKRLTRVVSDEPAGKDAQAGAHRSGEGWRLIQGSESPVYQELGIGWNVKGDAQLEKDDDGAMFYDPAGNAPIENVVVDLKSGSVIGKTNGTHSSDKARFSQAEMTNQVVWSSSREFMVQLAQAKHFDTMFAELYHLPEMSRVSAGVDVLGAVKSALISKMKGKVQADDFSVGLHDVLIAQRGKSMVLSTGVSVMLSDGDGPDFTITFKVAPSAKGAPKLTLQTIESHE